MSLAANFMRHVRETPRVAAIYETLRALTVRLNKENKGSLHKRDRAAILTAIQDPDPCRRVFLRDDV